MEQTDFSWALRKLLSGREVSRPGWNGSGMTIKAQIPDENSKMTQRYLYMVILDCKEGTRMLPWMPSTLDLFARDWEAN